MGFSDKRGMSGLAVTLIIGVLVILFMLGGAGEKILHGAESLAGTLGITTAKSAKVKATTSLLSGFYSLCAAEPGTNCVCSTPLNLFQPGLFSDKDVITFSEKDGGTLIDFVGSPIAMPGIAPCLFTATPEPARIAFGSSPATQPSPQLTSPFSFEYRTEDTLFVPSNSFVLTTRMRFDEPVDFLPLKSLRLFKLSPNSLCVLSEAAVKGVQRTCKDMAQCSGRVCTGGQACSTGKFDPYYQGAGVCCSGECIAKPTPGIEAQMSHALAAARAARFPMTDAAQQLAIVNGLRDIYTKYPTSEYADDALAELAGIYFVLDMRREFFEAANLLLNNYPISPFIARIDTMSDNYLSCTDKGFSPGFWNSADERAKCNTARDSLLTGCVFIDNWGRNECKSCKAIGYSCSAITDKETCNVSPCAPKSECYWHFYRRKPLVPAEEYCRSK
jgi:hypothetical protein